MFPEKYIKDLESSRRRRRLIHYISGGLLFLLGFLIIGPGVHEISHIVWLDFHSCFYEHDLNFSAFRGVYGSIAPACNLNTPALVVFYSIGYFTTLLLGTVLDFYARATEGRNYRITMLSLGILISVLSSIGLKGDLQSLADVIGAPSGSATVLSVFITLGILSLTYKTVKDFEHQNGRNATDAS